MNLMQALHIILQQQLCWEFFYCDESFELGEAAFVISFLKTIKTVILKYQ
jgi:hypothetical protein